MTERPGIPRRVVIAGASTAGLAVAETLRADGFDGAIALLGAERHAPYRRPAVSKQLLGGTWGAEDAELVGPTALAALGIDFRPDTAALGLDPIARRVTVADAELPFDAVVIATGASAARPPAFARAPEVLTIRTLDDAMAVRSRLGPGARVVVVGAGILGSEVASAAAAAGCRVTLLARGAALSLGSIGPRFSARLLAAHRAAGIEVRLDTEVRAVDGTRLRLRGGERIVADVVVLAAGALPAVDWLRSSGLLRAGQLTADGGGQVAPRVFAAGDAVAWSEPEDGPPRFGGHQLAAREQGKAGARRRLGGGIAPAPIPFFWSDFCGQRVQAAGRFDPADRIRVLEGDEHEHAAVVGWFRAGRLRGVVGWNAPREFRVRRAELLLADDRPLDPTTRSQEDHHARIAVSRP